MAKKPPSVRYLDSNNTTALQMWKVIGFPAYQRFVAAPSWPTAMDAAVPAWHIHEWVWHELHPNTETRNNPDYTKFLEKLFDDRSELAWVRDIADAAKHCGLGRPTNVQNVEPAVPPKPLIFGGMLIAVAGGNVLGVGGSPLIIELIDGNRHDVALVLKLVAEFWQKWFALASPPPPK